jgi:xanthine dehydrogenase YagR molybdenum-binding subunit
VKQQLLALAAAQLKVSADDLVLKNGEIVSSTDASKKVAVTGLNALRGRGLIVGVGYRGPNPEGKVICPFGVHFAEVEVNTRTGEVRVLRYLAAQDSGRAMNELTFENQTQGGITMGIGLALTEERILDRFQTGKMVNRNWHDYQVPTSMDVPVDPVVLPVDLHDEQANSTGAKGLGEPATVPAAPAVANAIHHACGVRTPETPVNPRRLVSLLAASKQRG